LFVRTGEPDADRLWWLASVTRLAMSEIKRPLDERHAEAVIRLALDGILIGSEMSGWSVRLGRQVSRSSGMSNCRAPGDRKSVGSLRTVTWRM
jgi:hypothetical protein